MIIRELVEKDTKKFYDCMKIIDSETEFMMFEPNEREWNEELILKKINNKNDLLLGVIDEEEVVGFLSAERGVFNRIKHSAYIVIGLRKCYCNKGIGTELFKKLDDWALENEIIRLELTVECKNKLAIKLYEKSGFKIEGIKKNSMCVNEEYVDEYLMSKIF